jgi:hypothetical protein
LNLLRAANNASINIDLNILGYSLGGIIGGNAARYIIKASNGTFKASKLEALEPAAFPIYLYDYPKPTDAQFVTIVYLQGTLSGINPRMKGNATFYIDGAYNTQQNCSDPDGGVTAVSFAAQVSGTCAHLLIPRFWEEAVKWNSSSIFPALICSDWSIFKLHFNF